MSTSTRSSPPLRVFFWKGTRVEIRVNEPLDRLPGRLRVAGQHFGAGAMLPGLQLDEVLTTSPATHALRDRVVR